ncbi:hypothetical protein R1flu_000504 [Riccia fluitans]|uniref:Uncharacterized protein n=1 Tax=Riccia fluitans TaxID=41844 RepID=A0ABD1Y4S8_9MARC
MVQILATNDMSGLTLSKLSKEAFSYYLDKTQNPWGHKVWKWSLEEYKKLIQLLGWSVVQNGDEPAEFENLFCLPSPVSAARYLLDRDELRLFGNPASTVIENHKRLDTDAVKKTLQDLLPLIDLPSIHPELLVEVIKPLKIIDAELADTFIAQAVRFSSWLRNSIGRESRASYNWFGYEERNPEHIAVSYTDFKMAARHGKLSEVESPYVYCQYPDVFLRKVLLENKSKCYALSLFSGWTTWIRNWIPLSISGRTVYERGIIDFLE